MLGDRGIRGRIVAGIALVIVVVDAVHSFLWAGGDRTWIVLCGLSVLALVGLILARDRRWPKRHTTALFGTFLILGTASVLLPPSAYADAGWWLAAVSRLIPATVIGLCFLNVHPEEPAIRYGVPACALLLGGAVLANNLALTFGEDLIWMPGHRISSWTVKYHTVWLVFLAWGAVALTWRRSARSSVLAATIAAVTGAAVLFGSYDSPKFALGVSGAVFALAHLGGSGWRRVMAVGVAAYVLLAPFLWPLRVVPRLDLPPNWLERIIAYDVSSAVIRSNWWLGLGFGSSRHLVVPAVPGHGGHLPGGHPHNLPLMFWLEFGVFGAVLLVVSLFVLYRFIAGHTDGRRGAPACWAVLSAGIVIFSFSFDTWETQLVLLYTMVASLIVVVGRSDGGGSAAPNGAGGIVTRGLGIVATIGVLASLGQSGLVAEPSSSGGPPVVPLDNGPAELRVEAPIGSLEIAGTFENLVPTLDGLSVFEPVSVPAEVDRQIAVDDVFDFMSRSFHPWQGSSVGDLSAHLFGYGFGFSHVHAALTAALWREQGVEARVVNLGGRHTMAEARVDGAWRLYDAQQRCDFSGANGGSVSLDDMRQDPARISAALDPAGTSLEFLRTLLLDTAVGYDPAPESLRRPTLTLGAGQTMTIRRRSADATPWTVSEVSALDRNRDHLVPLYEIVIHDDLREPVVTIDTGLPMIDLSITGRGSLLPIVDGRAVIAEDGSSSLATALRGTTAPVTFVVASSRPTGVTATYLMAGWIGDRLFQDAVGSTLGFPVETGSIRVGSVPRSAIPRVGIRSVSAIPDGAAGFEVRVELAWTNLGGNVPLSYQIELEELAGSLPLQVWDHLLDWGWVWHPDAMDPSGTMAFTGNVRLAERIGPVADRRTLLAHVRGPGVATGVPPGAQLVIDLAEGGEPRGHGRRPE